MNATATYTVRLLDTSGHELAYFHGAPGEDWRDICARAAWGARCAGIGRTPAQTAIAASQHFRTAQGDAYPIGVHHVWFAHGSRTYVAIVATE